ncbi:chromosomal replication initiator protein DnaA [Sphingomonas sp.]|uniref:chromosomal replication initiator protein DnaA n=1 Tax=Sphingomonas sp. TaxID=28214 RepID=UPI0025CE32A7|nr:chromosomal replication initiator protein DnaA [Sphingomonas sp.]
MAVSAGIDGGTPGEVLNAWARIRKNLRESAGARLFEQWLKPIELGDSDDFATVRLTLPSAFTANWVRNHYADRLLQEFRHAVPAIRTVSIEVRSATAPVRVVAEEKAEPTKIAAAPADRPALDSRLTFDRFVADPSNRVALNAARALAEPGTPRFSPLFLHSGTGLGKTHLMHAIGHAYLAAVPEARVILMSAERFMFEFVAAIRANDTHGFKNRLRSSDLLMIDDLHFISGKKPTQDEFFHTINELTAAGKRLVITADRHPHGLDDVEARIVSRLSMGLVADIKTPNADLRRALLDHRLSELPDVHVPEDVLDLLAHKITGSLREVEGGLNRLVAYAQLTGEAINLDFAQATLGDVLRGGTKRITIDEIQRAVSVHFDLKPVDLVSARRAVVVARPRQIAMYLAKRLTTRSLPEIGRKFGGRDHSTVIHAVRRIEELRGSDHEIDGAVKALIRQLEG